MGLPIICAPAPKFSAPFAAVSAARLIEFTRDNVPSDKSAITLIGSDRASLNTDTLAASAMDSNSARCSCWSKVTLAFVLACSTRSRRLVYKGPFAVASMANRSVNSLSSGRFSPSCLA